MAAAKRRRKSFSVAAPFWIFAAATILLLPPSTPAQGQAPGPSCDEDGQRNSGDTDASSSGPQCWEGTLQAHAQGNIYNDTADGKFKFTAADDDTVTGTAHIRMSHAPATMPGGCIFTRSQDPEEFDVTIDGRRNADRFELNFGTALATYTITTKCQGHSGTGSTPGMDAFMGGSDVVLRDSPLHGGPAKVPAEDGSTTLHGSLGGDNRATATIQITCKRGCILPRAAD